mgnify:CR=1 FL=1
MYRQYASKFIIPDILLCLDCDVQADDVLGFDFSQNPNTYLFDVTFMHTSQMSKAANLIRDMNCHDYAAPYMDALHTRDESKIRKYTQALGEDVRRRFMPIVFDSAGGISEPTYKLLQDRFKDLPAIRAHLTNQIYEYIYMMG